MTTDTAVRVTRMVVLEKCIYVDNVIRGPSSHLTDELEKIPYVDHPEIKVDEHESTQMPFRYVTDSKGQGIFPEVRSLPSMHLI